MDGAKGWHWIEDDLDEAATETYTLVGLAELDTYLAKQAAFGEFLRSHNERRDV